MQGEITSPIDPKPGCRFMARCSYADKGCAQPQELRELARGILLHVANAKALNKLRREYK
jgi:peptide/nickel transport system ATP-binding protein